MRYTHCERLSALDNSFLDIEDGASHMHIGAVAIFEGGPFVTPDGGIDIDRIRRMMEVDLHRVPRYRQRLMRTPLFGQPVWVDDEHFNLAYHVRHTHLPKPGDDRQLKRFAGRVMSQELDRRRPLWEMWVVEGLAGGRFAIVTKAHHCMIDGVGSVQLTGAMMRPTADVDARFDEPPPRWLPRAAPSGAELVLSEITHRTLAPAKALVASAQAALAPRSAAQTARTILAGIGETLSAGFHPASPTPLNVDIGPHRRFDWTVTDLAAFKPVRARFGGTVNDVVLAALAGALGTFFRRRGIDPAHLDFRVMVPVNVRDAATRGQFGNQVAMLVVPLPIGERSPVRRLERTIEETHKVKRSRQAAGIQSIEALSDATFPALMAQFARLTALTRPFNLVTTNVPGPPVPVYVAGARMLACYPLVPLFQNQALGVALFSYDGRLHWGFNADWDVLPDLHDLVEAVERELATILALDGTAPAAASA
jgi:WS/DGAT/MGAT family acyltransferase